jgi:hypothetical protein
MEKPILKENGQEVYAYEMSTLQWRPGIVKRAFNRDGYDFIITEKIYSGDGELKYVIYSATNGFAIAHVYND